MWKDKIVSVIFPTYNEKESVQEAIQDFFSSGYVDEIIVVNNNAAPGTSQEVAKTKAKEVFEQKQGYGFAIRRGFEEAKGDIVIISEPDGTFVGRDVIKLLAYSEEFEAVFGTRTTKELIMQGANMGFFLKWGNWTVAKLIEVLFNTTILTDVGCTMKLLSRNALEKIKDQFTVGGSHFGVELMLLVIINKINFFEIPLNYSRRVGLSSVTGKKHVAFLLGLKMISLIIKYRMKSKYQAVRDLLLHVK
ncbi:glycosyltransferase family 2 protein [bacterium]|nr:glycosyltransferase family 2 protein [bacterium]